MSYWSQTRSPLYSFVFTLPLFFLYEIGLFAISSRDIPNLRNGADVLMRQVLAKFGLLGLYGFGLTLLLGFLIIYLIQRRSWNHVKIQGDYLLYMVCESLIWGAVLYWIMLTLQQVMLMNPTARLLIQQVILSVGAGIYEEFMFRVLLISGFTWLLGFIFQWQYYARQVGAVVLAAVIFSLFHFVGELGDTPDIYLFLMRFLAGLFLGGLYSLRGFGITAYTHGIYDLIILVRLVT